MSVKKERTRIIIMILAVTMIAIEVAMRAGCAIVFDIPFFHTGNVILNYYPELEKLSSYRYDDTRINLLVFGGSVLTEEVFTVEIDHVEHKCHFCNMEDLLADTTFNVVNLARSGQNSMDSRTKYDHVGKAHFDAVFVYHGINDTRTNNVSEEGFNRRYRHVEFYDDLAVVNSHPELTFIATPFMLHWLYHSIRKSQKNYIPKEMFRGLLFGEPEPFLREGSDIKSGDVFFNNFEHMIRRAKHRNEYFVLSTYAWYMPDNYSYEKFKQKELDFDEQIFPTELYGLPENVVKGLTVHNDMIRKLHQFYPDCGFIDMESSIAKSAANFNDVCHLNENGCRTMSVQLGDHLQNSL